MSLQRIDFSVWSPFRRPDWRFERVLEMVQRETPGRTSKRDDEYVQALRNFILRYRAYTGQPLDQLAFANPGLYWAYQIHDRRHDDGARMAVMIEARILAGQNNVDIAKELCTIPEVIDWYEKIFFNVRDRLHAHDWVVDHVLMPAFLESRISAQPGQNASKIRQPLAEAFFDPTLKFFAYFGGPFVLDFVLTGFRRGNRCRNREETGQWFDTYWANRLKQRSSEAVGTFEVNKYNVMQLFETHRELIKIEKSVDAQEGSENDYRKGVAGLLHDMRWAVGKDGEHMVEGTVLASYDKGAAELRDHEMMLLSAGRNPGTIEGAETLELPPPRRRSTEQEAPDASANVEQGR